MQIVGAVVAGVALFVGIPSLIGSLISTPDDWEYERCDDPSCPDREVHDG